MKPTSDLDSQHYRENSALQEGHALEFVRRFDLREDDTLLDVGCGDGRITAELSKKLSSGRIVGIDPSSAMVELANESYPKKHFPNLSFKVGGAESIEEKDCYSVITSFSAVHWVPDHSDMLKRFHGALKNSGRLNILAYGPAKEFWYPIDEVVKLSKWSAYFPDAKICHNTIEADEWKKLLSNSGFSLLNLDESKQNTQFSPVKSSYIDYVRGFLPWLMQLDPKHHEAFMGDIGDLFVKATNAKSLDGSVTIAYELYQIEAVKSDGILQKP